MDGYGGHWPQDNIKAAQLLDCTVVLEVKKVTRDKNGSKPEPGNDKNPLRTRRMFTCAACGNIVLDAPPKRCPVCGAYKQQFRETT